MYDYWLCHCVDLVFYCFSLILFLMFSFFFFNDTATTEIYTLSLHDALPISYFHPHTHLLLHIHLSLFHSGLPREKVCRDRKSTRLNSSHGYISYAVFCLKKKKKNKKNSPHHTKHKHKLLLISLHYKSSY